MLPQTLLACLSAFEPCFTAPSYHRFTAMMSGWLLCIGKHTITGAMRSGGLAATDPGGFHRFFSRGAWSPDDVGRVVLRMALKLVPPGHRVMLTLDDTLARHTGKRLSLPFFARLYRSVKAAEKASVDHVKRTIMAA